MLKVALAVMAAWLFVLPASASAQDTNIASVAGLLARISVGYNNSKRTNQTFETSGPARGKLMQQALRHAAWTMIVPEATRRAGDVNDDRFIDPSGLIRAFDQALGEPPQLHPVPKMQARQSELQRAARDVDRLRTYSRAFDRASTLDIARVLNSMRTRDPLRVDNTGGLVPEKLDTVEDYIRQIDTVIGAVEKAVSGGNAQFVERGYKVAPERRWAVYRDVIRQFRSHDEKDLSTIRNQDGTWNAVKFVEDFALVSTDEILRSAEGRTDAENERDKVEPIDDEAIDSEMNVI